MKILYIILSIPFFLSANNYWSPINNDELNQNDKIIDYDISEYGNLILNEFRLQCASMSLSLP